MTRFDDRVLIFNVMMLRVMNVHVTSSTAVYGADMLLGDFVC